MAEEPEASDETVAFLFDLAKDAPHRNVEHVRSLDQRTGQSFTAATVLIGFVALVTTSGRPLSAATDAFLALTALIYVLIASFALRRLRPMEMWGLPRPQRLWENYKRYPLSSIQAALLRGIIRDAPKNDALATAAENTAKYAVALVAAEATSLAIALLLSRVT